MSDVFLHPPSRSMCPFLVLSCGPRVLHQRDPGVNGLIAILRQEAAQIGDDPRGDQHVAGEVVVPQR